jgi:hypothetical protein
MSEKFYRAITYILPFLALLNLLLIFLGMYRIDYLNPLFIFPGYINEISFKFASQLELSDRYLFVGFVLGLSLIIWILFLYGLYKRSIYSWFYLFLLFLQFPLFQILVEYGQMRYFIEDLLGGSRSRIISTVFFLIYYIIGIPLLIKLKKYYH